MALKVQKAKKNTYADFQYGKTQFLTVGIIPTPSEREEEKCKGISDYVAEIRMDEESTSLTKTQVKKLIAVLTKSLNQTVTK